MGGRLIPSIFSVQVVGFFCEVFRVFQQRSCYDKIESFGGVETFEVVDFGCLDQMVPALEGLDSQGCLQPLEGLPAVTRMTDFLPD